MLLLAGCSSGSSGGGADTGNQSEGVNGIAAQVNASPLSGNRFQIDYILQADTAKELGVRIEYSEDLGITYRIASLDSSLAGNRSADRIGVANTDIWEAELDLSSLSQNDLGIRVTPFNLSSRADGIPAESPTFGIGASDPPQIVSISTPRTPVGGQVEFTYTVRDAQSDFVSLWGQHSTDGGSTFVDSTLNGGDGTSGLTSSPGGITHVVYWDAQGDLPEVSESDVVFRLRASDSGTGAYRSTALFELITLSPVVQLLTVNRIPASMNGSTTFLNTSNEQEAFRLGLPLSGSVIDLEIRAHALGAALDPSGVELWSSQALGGGSAAGGFDPGEDFGVLLDVDLASGTAAVTVDSQLEFTTGTQTLSARVRDVLGNLSAPVSFRFDTRQATATILPFDRPDRWHLTFTRDNFTIDSSTSSSGQVTITTTATPNGVEDFVEDLRIVGLNSASPPPEAIDAGVNEFVEDWVQEEIVGRLNTLFGHGFDGNPTPNSPGISFHRTRPAGTHSAIGIGGDDPVPGFTIGRAEFDYRNATANDNTAIDLGVFSTNYIAFYVNSSFTFRQRFDPLIPGRGTPVGFDPDDASVLTASFDRFDPGNSRRENERYDETETAVQALASAIAVVLAHEVGHSIGLVAGSAPTSGLFGGEFNASFSGPFTTSFHLDSPGNNIMAASLSFTGSIATGPAAPAFNALNTAYMLHRLLLY